MSEAQSAPARSPLPTPPSLIQKPIILAITNTKGGVGKTTLAVNVAATLAADGYKVLLVDGDDQESANDWMGEREKTGIGAEFDSIAIYGPDISAIDSVESYAQYDVVLIDTPGATRENTSLQAAAGIAHMAIIPIKRSTLETNALGKHLAPALQKMKAKNRRLKFLAVQCMIDQRRGGNNELTEYITNEYGVAVANTWITWRASYVKSLEFGACVVDLNIDPKATAEVRALVTEILAHFLTPTT